MTELRESLVSDKQPLISVLIIIAVSFSGFLVIGPMIGFMLAQPFYAGDNFMADLVSGSMVENSSVPLLIVQGCTSFIGLIAMPMLYIRFSESRSIGVFFKPLKNFALSSGVTCLLVVAFIVVMSPIAEWNTNLHLPESLKDVEAWLRAKEDTAAEMTAMITSFQSFSDYLLAFVVIAVIAGIGEEFVFRGLIQNELHRSSANIHVAIWASAFLFSAFHLQFFGFFPRLFLGAVFGYLYYWSGSLWIPVIAHIFNNGFILTVFYLKSLQVTDLNLEEETSAPLSWVVVCAVASFTLLYFFKKQYSSPPEPS
jgi:uncharacterized protein